MGNWYISSGNNSNLSYTPPLQNVKLKQTAGPTLTIVSRTEAKNYCKMGSDTTDDSLFDDLIKSATSIIERECGGLAICEQTWKQYQKGGIETIELLRQPVIGVPTVSYYEDFDDTVPVNITYSSYCRIVDNTLYHVDGFFNEGRDGDGYTITFKTGLFTSSTYTSSDLQELQVLKIAICRTIAFLYENREEYLTKINEGEWSVSYDGELPIGIKTLIMPIHTGKGLI